MKEYFIKKIKQKKFLNIILKELEELTNYYIDEKSLPIRKKTTNSMLNDKLLLLAKKDRALFGRLFDASQCMPSLHALSKVILKDIKNIYKYKIVQIADYPLLRLDLPEKNSKHNDPWHQEAMAYDAPRDSVTVWIPMVKMEKELGRLSIKGNSEKIGLLDFNLNKIRPYIRVKNGKWKNLPTLKPYVPFGHFMVFNNAVPHKSSNNISGNKVRISIQVRYNFLDNSIYTRDNYIPTVPKKISVQNNKNFKQKRFFKI